MSEFAFILGNGETRLCFNPEDLMSLGKVYACNRVYQEFTPDVLVSTDTGMAREIQESGYSQKNVHYTRESNIIPGSGARALNPEYTGFSSGPNGLALAADHGSSYLFLIGFDLVSQDQYVNNIYADTPHYVNSSALKMNPENWIKQISEIIQKYKNQRVIHVNPLLGFTPASWLTLPNFQVMDIAGFRFMLNI